MRDTFSEQGKMGKPGMESNSLVLAEYIDTFMEER